jgi:glutaredoxin
MVRMKSLVTIAAALLCLALTAAPAIAGGIYKWTDATGQTHYSSTPPAEVPVTVMDIRDDAPSGTAAPARRDPITLLTASWCGVCKAAKRWLAGKDIPYEEYDVEKSTTGQAKYRELHGRAVPIILVGNRRMNGFSPDRLAKMLSEAGY